jgi:hypothetical protein
MDPHGCQRGTSALRRFGGIDVMKHLLAMSVIFIHTRSGLYSADTISFSDSVIEWIDGAVMGFFLISGFFFPLRRLPSDARQFLKFGGARAARLLIPFLLFSVLYAIAMAILGKMAFSEGLWLTVTLHGSSMQLYFLPLLFACEILMALWFILTAEIAIGRGLHAIGLLALILLSLRFPTEFSTGSDPRLFGVYALAFGIGLVLKASASPTWPAIMIIGASAILSISDERFIDLLLVTALFWGARTASRSSDALDRSFPGSGGIYLLHTTIINFAIVQLLAKLGVVQVTNLVATVILTYLVCLAATLIAIRAVPRLRFLLLE